MVVLLRQRIDQGLRICRRVPLCVAPPSKPPRIHGIIKHTLNKPRIHQQPMRIRLARGDLRVRQFPMDQERFAVDGYRRVTNALCLLRSYMRITGAPPQSLWY
jgi:hypothetical protein